MREAAGGEGDGAGALGVLLHPTSGSVMSKCIPEHGYPMLDMVAVPVHCRAVTHLFNFSPMMRTGKCLQALVRLS